MILFYLEVNSEHVPFSSLVYPQVAVLPPYPLEEWRPTRKGLTVIVPEGSLVGFFFFFSTIDFGSSEITGNSLTLT